MSNRNRITIAKYANFFVEAARRVREIQSLLLILSRSKGGAGENTLQNGSGFTQRRRDVSLAARPPRNPTMQQPPWPEPENGFAATHNLLRASA